MLRLEQFKAYLFRAVPGKLEYFRYNWRRDGLWNLLFLAGILLGRFHRVSLGSGARCGNLPSHQSRPCEAGHSRFFRDGSARVVQLARAALAARICLRRRGRLLRWLRHGLCWWLHLRPCDYRPGELSIPLLNPVCGFFVSGLAATYFLLPLLS